MTQKEKKTMARHRHHNITDQFPRINKILEKTLPKVVSDGYNIRVFTDAQSLEEKSITTYNEPNLTLLVHINGKEIVVSP